MSGGPILCIVFAMGGLSLVRSTSHLTSAHCCEVAACVVIDASLFSKAPIISSCADGRWQQFEDNAVSQLGEVLMFVSFTIWLLLSRSWA